MKTKSKIVITCLIAYVLILYNNINTYAAENITRILKKQYDITGLPKKQVIQAFDLYQNNNVNYLFALQQGDDNGTPVLSIYKLTNNKFVYQDSIKISNGGHGDSLAVEGNHIWTCGTKSGVPVIKRIGFQLLDENGRTKIKISTTKIIKNLAYDVVNSSLTADDLKKAFVAVTDNLLCIKTSFKPINITEGYYRVYKLNEINKALDGVNSEMALNKVTVGKTAKLATFYCSIDKFQGMDIDNGYIYSSTGGKNELPVINKFQFSLKLSANEKQKITVNSNNYIKIKLYRNSKDTGKGSVEEGLEPEEAEGIQRITKPLGPFSAGTYIIPGEFAKKDQCYATLYFVTSKTK